MKEQTPIMKLKASYHNRPWGGEFLTHVKKISPLTLKGGRLGEAWEVSLLQDGPSTYGDLPLSQIVNDNQIPYLIKFLDTSEFLSVQVHPDDHYAQKVAHSKGKTECWAVVKAGEGAGIFLGVKQGVTRQNFFHVIEQSADPSSMMNFYPVQMGDFFFVPAGSLHAIGKNITLIEVQQSCGITYRVWDWNRLDSAGKARELHINHAREVVCFSPQKNSTSYFQHKGNIFVGGRVPLAKHRDFLVSSFMLEPGMMLGLDDNDKRFSTITVADGVLQISRQGIDETIGPYESALLPNGFGSVSIKSIQRCFGVIVE
ncbi:MAG: class I mannose-6-phosphate isomerase [Bdellovibrio sp.]|nr:class I mannose-6-phosphate isomerase [Bdellovibrio sp.]